MHVFHWEIVSGGYDMSMHESAYFHVETVEIIICV